MNALSKSLPMVNSALQNAAQKLGALKQSVKNAPGPVPMGQPHATPAIPMGRSPGMPLPQPEVAAIAAKGSAMPVPGAPAEAVNKSRYSTPTFPRPIIKAPVTKNAKPI